MSTSLRRSASLSIARPQLSVGPLFDQPEGPQPDAPCRRGRIIAPLRGMPASSRTQYVKGQAVAKIWCRDVDRRPASGLDDDVVDALGDSGRRPGAPLGFPPLGPGPHGAVQDDPVTRDFDG